MVNIIKTFRPVYCLLHKPSRVVRVWCLLISGLFYLTAAINTASAATYYVDPATGNINNDGSASNPWSTAEEVFASKIGNPVQPGDTILLRSGYHGQIDYSNAFNSDYITIQAQSGHSPTFKRIKLTSCSKWILKELTISPEFATVFEQWGDGIIKLHNSQDIIIENNNIFSVQDASSWTANDWNSLASRGIHIQSSPNAIIRNNTINNVKFGVVTLWADGALIEYNIIEHNVGDGIQAYSTSNVIVQYNTIKNFYDVSNNHDDGIQFYTLGNDPPCDNVVLRGNLIILQDSGALGFPGDIQGIGFFDGPYDNLLVENNVVIVRHLHGIGIYGATNSKIINNIAFHPNPTYSRGVYIHTGFGTHLSSDTVVRNNIAHVISTLGTNITADHNIDIDDYGPDALFADYLNNDLRHADGSPAIDAGSPLLAPDIDILGTSRPQGNGYDIGAYEYIYVGAPVFDPIGDKIVGEDELLSFTVNATDPENEPITYSVANLPTGASFDPAAREFNWIPTHAKAGLHQLTFLASDGTNQGSAAVTITVGYAPVFNPIGDYSVLENNLLSFTVLAQDLDGNTLSYSVDNLPSGASFDSATGEFSWTPTYDDVGTYPLTFTVTDNVYTDSETITITVDFEDTDFDGLPDAWEIQYFGNLTQGANDDPDVDTFTNLQEYQNGTDPTVYDELPADLILDMRFDEGSGTTAQDSSGAGNTGTLMNGPVWTTGKVGNALSFDGIDDYVDIGNLDVVGTGLTLAAWFKADSFIASGNRLISKATGSSEQAHYWMLSTISSGGSKLRFRLKTNGSTNTLIATSGNINTDEWIHAAAAYDGVSMILYKDGAEVGTLPKTGTISINSAVPACIGQNPGGYAPFDGTIDEVHIYNRALTAGEILDLYNESTTPDTTAPSIPQSLTAQPISQNQIDLTWQASTDPESGISRYNIYRGGTQIGTSTTTSYPNIGLIPGTTYNYEVSAVNGAALESARSNVAQATTLAGNLPPDISAIPNTLPTKQVGQTITTAEIELATDPEGVPLTYIYSGWLTSLPYITTDNDGGSHTLHVEVSDGTNTIGKDIAITVNRPPILSAIGGQSVDENALLSISVNATDPEGQALTYSVSGLPNGAAFVSQALAWTPSYDQQGDYEVTFIASDGQAQDSEAITITVINVNRAPVFTAIDNKSVWADDPLIFTIDATDLDGDPITYSVGTMPSGATLTGQDFDWTPSQGQGGSYDVTFIASDGQSQDSQMVTITVDADSLAPAVTNSLPTASSIQAPLNNLINLNITDAGKGIDADSVTIKVNNNTVYTGDTNHYTSPYGDCRRLGTKADYRFVYQSNELFDYDQTVDVTVTATDFAGNTMSGHSYSFVTEMRSFGKNKNVDLGNLKKGRPATVRDSNGDIWAAWHAGPIGGNRDIYIGKLVAEEEYFGDIINLTEESTADQCNPVIAVGSDDKLYVVWQDNRQGNWDIYVSTSLDGISWTPETMVNNPENDPIYPNQIDPAIVIDGQNLAYVVWQDDRAGNPDIYIATSSDDFVTTTVSEITSDISDQIEPAIAADSSNTVYVVWTDTRNRGKKDIYGAASNNSQWTNVPVVTEEDGQSSPAIATEAVGSILHLVWVDDRPGDDDIYYDKTIGGLSPLTGRSIIDDTSDADQISPVIITTGSTGNDLGVFACWRDERNEDADLYCVEIGSGNETNVFVGDDGTSTDQSEPAIGIDIDDYPYLVWTNERIDICYAGSTFVEPVALASTNVSISSPATVGTTWNAINSLDDISAEVPQGAYLCDVKITISKIKNPPKSNLVLDRFTGTYEFGPSGMEFIEPVTITIPYEVNGSENVSYTAYWYNPLTSTLSQQGITDVETIVISSTLRALRFKTTHFSSFILGGVVGGGSALLGGGGGGGGCSVSANSEGNILEFFLPYIAFVVVLAIRTVRDARYRKARST